MSYKKILIINVSIFLSFITLYFVSIYLWQLNLIYGNLLFLPHSIRIIAALIFGWISFPGLLLAHIFCEVLIDGNNNIILPLYGAIIVFLVIEILKYFEVFDFQNFNNVSFINILFIVFLASIFNSIGSFLILDYIYGTKIGSFNFVVSYIIGDFLGGFVGLYIYLKLFYKFS